MSYSLITYPAQIAYTRNRIPLVVQATGNWASTAGYEFSLKIEIEKGYRSGVWEQVDLMYQTPEAATGYARFDLGKIVDGYVARRSDNPGRFGNGSYLYENSIVRYRWSVADEADGVGLSQTYQGTGWGFHGALSEYDSRSSSLMALAQGLRLLTHYPPTKVVTSEQPEWITMVAMQDGGFDIAVSYTKKSGAFGSTRLTNQVNALQYDVMSFAVGYKALALDLITPADPVVEWSVKVMPFASSLYKSGIQKYRLDTCPCDSMDRYFVFRNSRGGYDTVHCRGDAVVQPVVQGETVQRILSVQPDPWEASSIRINTAGGHDTKQNVGVTSRAERAWLDDMKFTPELYRLHKTIYPVDGLTTLDWFPLRLTELAAIHDDGDDVPEFYFNYTDANENFGL